MKVKHKKVKILILAWLISITTGISAEFTSVFYLAILAFLSTLTAIGLTIVYLAEHWNNYD